MINEICLEKYFKDIIIYYITSPDRIRRSGWRSTDHRKYPVADGCTMHVWSKSKLGFSSIDSCALFAPRDLPQFQTSYQQVARLRGRPVAHGRIFKAPLRPMENTC